MTYPLTVAETIIIALAIGQLIFAALEYRRKAPPMSERQPRRHPILVIGLFMLLTWGVVAFEIYDRHYNTPISSSDIIKLTSAAPPHTYTMMVQSDPLLKYKDSYKLMLITRVQYVDRDRMTDTNIDKSAPYTITGGEFVLASNGAGNLRFIPQALNPLEWTLVMIPSSVGPDQIRNLEDVVHLGGRILGSQAQTVFAGPADNLPTPKQ